MGAQFDGVAEAGGFAEYLLGEHPVFVADIEIRPYRDTYQQGQAHRKDELEHQTVAKFREGGGP